MEKTSESVAAEIQALKRSLSEVSTAIDEYTEFAARNIGNKDTKATGEVSALHKALSLKTHALMGAVRGPVDMLISNIENSTRQACLRTVLEMGVFEAIPTDGSSVTASSLAEKLGVEKDLLVRLMRALTANGPFVEVGKEEYAHTSYSKIYLVPGLSGFFKASFDEFNLANAKMPEYFQKAGFKSPTSQHDNPYTYAHQTGGKEFWEHLAQFPARDKAMSDTNKNNGEHQAWTIGLFPFHSELQKFETTEDTVLLVDIGGGSGSVSKRLKELIAGIEGKIVLQDRAVVLEGIEELPGRESMAYDIFTPQPVQGALIYYIRHVLHDWSHDDCVLILKQVALAMKPGVSRLVISDSILPETNVDAESTWMDIIMMALGGSERTQTQWEKMLVEAGFKLHRIYQAPGTHYAAIEAYLK